MFPPHCWFLAAAIALAAPAALAEPSPAPAAPAPPRINGPAVIGVRPGHPVLYSVPATGERPLTFSADGLPAGVSLNATTGTLAGTLKEPGEHRLTLRATNAHGTTERPFRLVAGDRIALTPPMGWSSWNCFGAKIDQEKILAIARAMVASGLSQHGYTYINIDDGWQGKRTGPDHALTGNERFPDLAAMVREIHALGLKAGLYSTPWETSYAKFPGGSAETADGTWQKLGWKMGRVSFAQADAAYWAALGFDYLKYDWFPNDLPHVEEMSRALRASGRDIVYSLSNSGRIADAAGYAKWAELWRTTGDIYDVWRDGDKYWHFGVSEIAFSQDRWAPFAGPGHWNDPDMLVLGRVGWGGELRPVRLTPDEQTSHFSMWCLLAAPLLIGGDLRDLDAFTLGLLTNDEVIAIDQDELGQPAVRVGTNGPVDFYLRPLADGSHALGIFNRSDAPTRTGLNKFPSMGLDAAAYRARDLWRHRDLEAFSPKSTTIDLPAHGVVLLRLWKI